MRCSTLFSVLLLTCLFAVTLQAPTPKSSEKDAVVKKSHKSKTEEVKIAEKEEDDELVPAKIDGPATIEPKSNDGDDGEEKIVTIKSTESQEVIVASGSDPEQSSEEANSESANENSKSVEIDEKDNKKVARDVEVKTANDERLNLAERTTGTETGTDDDSDDSDSDYSSDSDSDDSDDDSNETVRSSDTPSADVPIKQSVEDSLESSGAETSKEQ